VQELDPTIDAQWARVRGKLKAEFGEATFKSWLKPLTLVAMDRGEIRIAVPTRFMRDWVRSHYADRIRMLWAAENRNVRSIEIVVQSTPVRADVPAQRFEAVRGGRPLTQVGARGGVAQLEAPTLAASAVVSAAADDRDEFGAFLDPRFTFDNWVMGKSNEFATAAARRVADEAKVPFNPLFLYGGVGLGKTHLMHAIAWHIRKRHPQRRVIYLSAEKFMYQFIRALRFKDTMAFKEQFRSVDVLMIDDVQFISGKDSTQEEFFHTFNALVDQNRQIILSADKSPTDLEGLEERVRSRLGWGLVADIHPTTYELRLGILQSKAEHLGQPVQAKVLEFLAHKITSNIRELEGALNRIVAHATLVGRPITLETAQEVLHDLLRANDRRVTIEEIQKRVAEHYSIRLADMHSPRRARAVARPRQVAMYLAKQLTSRSLPEIGRKFGGRDHTTVMHAVRKIEELRASDQSFSEDIDLLRRMLEA
jgi:chromosomal replication initiator protein